MLFVLSRNYLKKYLNSINYEVNNGSKRTSKYHSVILSLLNKNITPPNSPETPKALSSSWGGNQVAEINTGLIRINLAHDS